MQTNFTRWIGLLILLGVFAAAVLLLMPVTAPAPVAESVTQVPAAPVQAYPPPVANTPLPTATVAAYPGPNGEMVTRTPLPTAIPTATPWRVSDLPPLPTYAPPGPFQGMRVLYVKDGILQSINLQTGEVIQMDNLQNHPILGSFYIEFMHPSPNGDKVLYNYTSTRIDFPELASIWVMDSDGANLHSLLTAPKDLSWYPTAAIWSPDGQQIAYLKIFQNEAGEITNRELWIMDKNGQNSFKVFAHKTILNPYFNHVFYWAFNGYIYIVNAEHSLYAIDPQHGNIYRLGDDVDSLVLRMALSPTGEIIIDAQNTVSTSRLSSFVKVMIDGELVRWSLDGKFLLFKTENRLFLKNASTGEIHPIAFQNLDKAQILSLSPDNRYLLYKNEGDIFILDILPLGDSSMPLIQSNLGQPSSIYFIGWLAIP